MFNSNLTTGSFINKRFCLLLFRKAFAILVYSIITISGFFMQSCVSCPDNKGNKVNVIFFNRESNLPVQPYNRVYLKEKDTILTFDGTSLKLDTERNQSTYILSNSTGELIDTIIFTYKSSIEYLDSECGIQFNITDFHVNSTYHEARIVNIDEKLNEWKILFFR